MAKIETDRVINDELLNTYTPSMRDRLFGFFLYFRLGHKAESGPKCLYINYKCVGSTVSSLGTIMDVADVNRMSSPLGAKRLCFISDTHERHHVISIPKCDILVHMGDILFCGRKQSLSVQLHKLKSFGQWLESQQQVKHRLLVGGNHDKVLEYLNDKQLAKILPTTIVLRNQRAVIEGLRFYGSPYSSGLSKNKAFQGEAWRDKLIEDTRNKKDIDVLVTHGDDVNPMDYDISCKVHAWGHHHTKFGVEWHPRPMGEASQMREGTGVLSVCATIMDKNYRPSQLPIVVDLEPAQEGHAP